MSQSEKIRNEGLKCFHRATQVDANSSPAKARIFFEQALCLFYQAKEIAEDGKDELLAAINIGETAWRIAHLRHENETIFFYLHEAIKGFLVAYNHTERRAEWGPELVQKLASCYQKVITMTKSLGSLDQKIAQVEKLCTVNTFVEMASDIQLILATLYYYDGVSSLGNGNYIKCLKRMNDSNQSLGEVRRLGEWLARTQLEEEIALQCDVRCYFRLASSNKALSLGDELFELALQEEENFGMELIPDVIEWYKQAVNFAREINIGLVHEAIARSRLGEVYDKVLKNTDLAKVHFTKCLELVEALKPQTFFLDPWYNECIAALKRYQDEARAREEEEQQKSRAVVKEKLADVLKDLKDHNSDAISFIKHLYLKYPPMLSSRVKPGEEDMKKWDSLVIRSKEYKKLLLNTLRSYHPDKAGENERGKEWEVLCEEITKMLNLHYESVKDI